MTPQELAATVKKLEALAVQRRNNRLLAFDPYPKQREFFALGASKRERALMAGNQQGKTYAGAGETAYHLTGLYPSWWAGRKFDHPIKAWAAGVSSIMVRDVPQTLLCGPHSNPELLGTGLIPKHTIQGMPNSARGVSGLFDTIYVEHRTEGIVDGVSALVLKSYEQGREKFQSDTVDWLWLDEEPDEDVYMEALTRTNATGGSLIMTATPLKGMSKVVARYLDDESPDRATIIMGIEDALHISAEERDRIVASYKPHEREARVYGRPLLGEGRIFTVTQEQISEPAMSLGAVPPHWFKLWGIDFGIGHAFAAALLAWDKDTDVLHVLEAFKVTDALPIVHADRIKKIAENVVVAWPHDGNNREKGSGEQLQMSYRNQGLLMRPSHATWETGGYSFEAGVWEMNERMTTGRLKIASHLTPVFDEIAQYHRKKGLVVKLKDDLISAMRIAVMDKRFGRQGIMGAQKAKRRGQQIADGLDFDVLRI